MDFQGFVNLGLGVICAGIGWFANTLWSVTQKLREDLSALHVKLIEGYVPNGRLDSVLHDINSNIHRILDKLDEKEEKK